MCVDADATHVVAAVEMFGSDVEEWRVPGSRAWLPTPNSPHPTFPRVARPDSFDRDQMRQSASELGLQELVAPRFCFQRGDEEPVGGEVDSGSGRSHGGSAWAVGDDRGVDSEFAQAMSQEKASGWSVRLGTGRLCVRDEKAGDDGHSLRVLGEIGGGSGELAGSESLRRRLTRRGQFTGTETASSWVAVDETLELVEQFGMSRRHRWLDLRRSSAGIELVLLAVHRSLPSEFPCLGTSFFGRS